MAVTSCTFSAKGWRGDDIIYGQSRPTWAAALAQRSADTTGHRCEFPSRIDLEQGDEPRIVLRSLASVSAQTMFMRSPETFGTTGYTPTAKLLHWCMAALLVCQYAVAWTMPHVGRNTVPGQLINLHFSLGILLLFVAAVRLMWRWTHPEPAPLDGIPPWHLQSARAVHGLIYVLLFALPTLGWMNASWRGFDVNFFGLFVMPKLLATRATGFGWTGDIHAVLSNYALTGLIGLHVLAALYHGIIRKDGVLARMMPAR